MTPLAFRDYILTQMSAEEALLRLLEGPLGQYEKLKFDESGEPVHPLLIMSMAAMDLGWNFAIEKGRDEEEVRGLIVGTDEYMKKLKEDDVAHASKSLYSGNGKPPIE